MKNYNKNKDIVLLKKLAKKKSTSKKEAVNTLINAGILDEDKNFTKNYEHLNHFYLSHF